MERRVEHQYVGQQRHGWFWSLLLSLTMTKQKPKSTGGNGKEAAAGLPAPGQAAPASAGPGPNRPQKQNAPASAATTAARKYIRGEAKAKAGKKPKGYDLRSLGQEFNVSPTTIDRRVREIRLGKSAADRNPVGRRPDVSTYLPFEEEEAMADQIDELNDWGVEVGGEIASVVLRKLLHAKKPDGLSADESAKYDKWVSTAGGDKWLRGFKKRHYMADRAGDATERLRIMGANKTMINNSFDTLEAVAKKYKLKKGQTWSLDEFGCSLWHLLVGGKAGTGKVLVRKGKKRVLACVPSERRWTTILGCISNGGKAMPPVVCWPKTRIKKVDCGKLMADFPHQSKVVQTDNGWMDKETYEAVWEQHFIPMLNEHVRPHDLHEWHLFAGDGPKVHNMTPDQVKQLKEKHNILLFRHGAHSSQHTQACDKHFFLRLRAELRSAAKTMYSKNTDEGKRLLKQANEYLDSLEGDPHFSARARARCCALADTTANSLTGAPLCTCGRQRRGSHGDERQGMEHRDIRQAPRHRVEGGNEERGYRAVLPGCRHGRSVRSQRRAGQDPQGSAQH